MVWKGSDGFAVVSGGVADIMSFYIEVMVRRYNN